MSFDAFISYPHQNKTVADAACAKLEAAGIRCWMAPRDIAPSAEWAAAIVEAIDQCKLMVLIFSSYANQSRQVHREVQQAFDGEKPVVPFRIEDVLPQKLMRYYMGSVQWLDAVTPPLERHLQELTASVSGLLDAALRASALRDSGDPRSLVLEGAVPCQAEVQDRPNTFSYDIYISYVEIDNEPDVQGISWVARFTKDVNLSLRQRLGRDVRIFCDKSVVHDMAHQGNSFESALRSSAIFLPICSPSYLQSEWAVHELQAFLEAAKDRGEGAHILPVEMLPLDVNSLAPAIKSLKRYRFYVDDKISGVPIVLSPTLQPELYVERMALLAHDLVLMLRGLVRPADTR